jgi:uncharacterized repeat protein (TIGR03803 family)
MQTYCLAAFMLVGIVSLTLGGGAARAENFSLLHTFTGNPDGDTPEAALINVRGTLYGTTFFGGANNSGSVYSITPAGVETVLYSFTGGGDGGGPAASLVNIGGVFYGTTDGGGGGCGTVFKVTPAGAETVLYAFKCGPNDGDGPEASLIKVNGALYGTTAGGGANDRGTVFKVSLTGKETILHSFGADGDGSYPEAGLIDVAGTLYGTTSAGGMEDYGTVFTINSHGRENVLYVFQPGTDASNPDAPLLNVGGTLYGTGGGGAYMCEKGNYSCGSVFKITTSGKEAVLYSFRGKPDGMYPVAGLINVHGDLYGTTGGGGAGRNCAGQGCGTIFKLTLAGVETILHSFSVDEGVQPYASLLKVQHLLYGTTHAFGDVDNARGTVFAVSHH